MTAVKYIIVTEVPERIKALPGWLVITPDQFLKGSRTDRPGRTKIINLCRSHDYLSRGYYVSMLAEARGYPCVPAVANIIQLKWRRNYEFALGELDLLLNKHFSDDVIEPASRTYTTYFGRHELSGIEPLARRLFDLFRFPIISFEVRYSGQGKWSVGKIEGLSFPGIPVDRTPSFVDRLQEFTGSAWRSKSKTKVQEKHWIAILHDPNEATPPSNPAALKNFQRVGRSMGLWVELITKSDFSSLLEYDALFIRETTAINNHTYRFAIKAEHEGIPSIDDTQSIIRCCNKVYLNDLLATNHIAMPRTVILDRKNLVETAEAEMTYPMVLKIPDGSFSKGVFKVQNRDELRQRAGDMLKKSDIIVCQEFLASEYDWRIGVLNGKLLFATKYFMAEGHWQIYNHDATRSSKKSGAHECVALDQVPGNILELALAATARIGNGLYGVDIKQLSDGSAVVIEVNDNPNIDHGVEDQVLGDALYRTILEHLVMLIEQ